MNNLKLPVLVPVVLVIVGSTLSLLAACGGSTAPTPEPPVNTATPTAPASAAYTPVTLATCAATASNDAETSVGSVSLSYTEPPSRAIALNQHVTEIMLALGLEDSMVGTAYKDDDILPEFQAAYQKIDVLADEYPGKEVILSVEPDFIYGGFSSAFGVEAAGPQEDLKSLGIGSYLTTAICDDGEDTLEDVYTDIRNIGKVFGVMDRAESLVKSLSEKVERVNLALDDVGPPLRAFLYDSGDDQPHTSVCCAMFNHLVESAGAANIFDDVPGRWSFVTWEEVIARDPEVIVLTDAVWSTAQDKMDLLLNTPAYSSIAAVKNRNFVTLKFSSLVPGIRNPDALQTLAQGFYPQRFE